MLDPESLAAAGATQARLKQECKRYGLPVVSLEVLLRHLTNNYAAVVGAERYRADLWEARAKRARPDYTIADWVMEEQ